MRDHLILLPGWGLGSTAGTAARRALHEREPHLNVLIEPLPSLDDAADWLDELDDNLPRDSWLAGWSLGGMLAGELAARRGDDCRGLLTLASNPCFRVREDWPKRCRRKPSRTFRGFPARTAPDPQAFHPAGQPGCATLGPWRGNCMVALPQLEREALVAGLQLLDQLDTRRPGKLPRAAIAPVRRSRCGAAGLPPRPCSSGCRRRGSTLAASHGLPLECRTRWPAQS